MKPLLILASLLAATVIGSIATAKDSTSLEPLYSAQFDDTYITIEVKSTGCTKPEDFSILATGKGGEDYSTLGIRRDSPDLCRAAPHLIKLQMELPPAVAALKEPYKLENLFMSRAQFPGNI